MTASLTLNFATWAELHSWVCRNGDTIPYADRPDVGAPEKNVTPLLPAVAPFNPFITDSSAQVAGITTQVPAAAAVVPPPPGAAIGPMTGGVEVDAKGLPWDGRIHGSTKTKNADGTWRQKRGLNDEALKTRIEAELRAAMAAKAPSAPGITTITESMVAPLVPNAPALTLPPAASAAAVVPPMPAAQQPAVPAAPVSSGETFGQLMARLAPITTANPASAAKLNKALEMFGLTAIAQLAPRPDLIGPFANTIDAMLAAA